jgi:Protein of unknown function (DUF3106)
MRLRLQFAGWLLALGMSAAMAVPCLAQGPRVHRVQNQQANRPPKTPKQQQRQAQKQAQRPQQQRQNSGANRPPNSNVNRPGTAAQSNNPNRPPSSYTPPARKFNELNPQEKQRVIENNRRLQNLSPAQRQELNARAENFNHLTPEQQNHIKNDIAPKWRQMPPERRQAIRQRLRVLQNMPESARNQRLNDPNFTRGMSEEDKATLHDLSHTHVGGVPDPPNE